MKRMDSHLLDRMPQASRRLTRTQVKIFSTLSITWKYAALSKDKPPFPRNTLLNINLTRLNAVLTYWFPCWKALGLLKTLPSYAPRDYRMFTMSVCLFYCKGDILNPRWLLCFTKIKNILIVECIELFYKSMATSVNFKTFIYDKTIHTWFCIFRTRLGMTTKWMCPLQSWALAHMGLGSLWWNQPTRVYIFDMGVVFTANYCFSGRRHPHQHRRACDDLMYLKIKLA
jgi:hypothetical protein